MENEDQLYEAFNTVVGDTHYVILKKLKEGTKMLLQLGFSQREIYETFYEMLKDGVLLDWNDEGREVIDGIAKAL